MRKLLLNTSCCILIFLFMNTCTFAEEHPLQQDGDITEETQVKLISFEAELDAYYTWADLYINLTDEPIPYVEEKNELQIYRDLFLSSYLPRQLMLEASVYPMPCLGAFIKKNYRDFYDDTDSGENFNLVEAVTAGFEEPWALSFFMGNIISFTKPGQKGEAGNKGYMGYLCSAGNYHIKDNDLIRDDWYEFEWKIKGDRKHETHELSWSFRAGMKIHENPEISDIVYISIRRSNIDFKASVFSIIRNSGFEYTYDMDRHTLDPVRHFFSVGKKIPFKNKKFALSLTLGCIWESHRKYSGSLKELDDDKLQFFIWPNLEF